MRTSPAIVVRNVSKKFRLFASPRERFLEALHPFRKQYHREFWALRDLSFEVERGEVVGILGRNGSGKSTLLQIICSVMQPTSGEVRVHGRIAALLELGAGFNPEFTGRDNVILNGQIMGLSRKEMLRRLPEIESFADIGAFFDQPVKTYSSGMFVRVAFAAAIHVDPDILVIDEALAVGDAKFQRKCLLQIEKIRASGAAILFVSHSLEAVTSLCSRAIILEKGALVADGEPKPIAEQYLALLFSEARAGAPEERAQEECASVAAAQRAEARLQPGDPFKPDSVFWTPVPISQRFGFNRYEIRAKNEGAAIVDYRVMVNGTTEFSSIMSGSTLAIYVKIHFTEDVYQPIVGFALKNDKGVTITGSNTYLARVSLRPVRAGEVRVYRIEFTVPLNEGDYFVDLGISKYDGSPGGYVLDVRRSILHLFITRMREKRFDGIVDIGFRYAEVDG